MSESLTLQLSKIIKAPHSRAFAAWTQPAQLMHWFAPGPMQPETITVDLRVGGTFRWTMRGVSPNAGPDMLIVFSGQYIEVIADKLLRFSWQSEANPDDSSMVTVAFADVDGGTEVALTQERLATNDIYNRNMMGWGSMLEKLAALAELSIAHTI